MKSTKKLNKRGRAWTTFNKNAADESASQEIILLRLIGRKSVLRNVRLVGDCRNGLSLDLKLVLIQIFFFFCYEFYSYAC